MNIDILKDEINKYMTQDEVNEIIKAYDFITPLYDGEYRLSNEEYILHPLTVAHIISKLKMDASTVCASLLHETLNMGVASEEIKQEFGNDVFNLVNGINQINNISVVTDTDASINQAKKIIIGICDDVRVIIIKLADRLHNMRSLYALPIDSQKSKAKETLEILAPIAHRLGLYGIKSELEDLSLRYLKKDIYYDIQENLNNSKLEREQTVNEMINQVSNILDSNNINHKIKGRAKSIYSIYNKLVSKNKKFREIYDLFALRIIVDNVQDCYVTIGLIHSNYKPFKDRFKDYIAMPKPNGYQSLHTSVFGVDDYIFEIQIRTEEMDLVAETGIAAHFQYKENNNSNLVNNKNLIDKKLEFFKYIMDLRNNNIDDQEFVDSVKQELLSENLIYVYTPNGKVIELVNGSNPIDFAYRIHTDVGNKMTSAIVNNTIVPFNHKLKSGDIVKININKNAKGPSREWINIAFSNNTKNKIKNFFRNEDKVFYLKEGEEILTKELKRKRIEQSTFNELLENIQKEYEIKNVEDLYYKIATNKVTIASIINYILGEKEEKTDLPILTTIEKKIDISNDIIVDGIDYIKVNLAKCCNPIKGDEIVGYITKSNGVTVHRNICPNISLSDRIISVEFNESTEKKFKTIIVVYTNTIDNILVDLVNKNNKSINIEAIKTFTKDDSIVYHLTLMVNNTEILNNYINSLIKNKNVVSVERLIL